MNPNGTIKIVYPNDNNNNNIIIIIKRKNQIMKMRGQREASGERDLCREYSFHFFFSDL